MKKAAVLLSAAMAVFCSVNVCADGGWKESYASVLQDKTDEEGAFSVYDIDGDGTPELIYSEGRSHGAQCEIYTYRGGKAVKIDEAGSSGVCSCIPQKHYLKSSYAAGGEVIVSFYTIEDNSLRHVMTFFNDENTGLEGEREYRINDEKVSKEEYYKRYSETGSDSAVSLGRSYPLGSDSIGYAVTGTDSCEDAYARLLRDKYTQVYDNDVFSLMDITGDKIPELFVRNDTSTDIYTFSDGRVQYMGSESLYLMGTGDAKYSCGLSGDVLVMHSKRDGASSYSFFSMKDGVLCREKSFRCGYDYDNAAVYMIDGREVSRTEYRTALKKYTGMRFRRTSAEYPLSESGIEKLGKGGQTK